MTSQRNTTDALVLRGEPLSITDLAEVAREGRQVRIGPEARSLLEKSENALASAVDADSAIYGVNTGFGSLARKRVAPENLRTMQHNLIRSHAAGVGPDLPDEIVRGMMIALAASLCRGRSGVRPVVVETIVGLLNAGVTPRAPEIGSVGASGDLAPLAHIALTLLGEGEAMTGGERISGADAIRRAGLAPLELAPKEGLALINGTHLMSARAALLLSDIDDLVEAAVCANAASMDACKATDAFLDPRVHAIRRQIGPARVARALRELLMGSEILPSHAENDPRVQDPYSFRCAPPVLGACLDQIEHGRAIVERELSAVTDNPLVFPSEGDASHERIIVSAGNFHGMPLALQLDALAIALAPIAGVAERRVYYTLAATDPEADLSPHLSPHPGLESGFMITQYTAAACCNELITLATPACVSNLPTCAGMEDYNSFGPTSAHKASRAVDLVRKVVAIELLCACEALDRHRPLKSGVGVEQVREIVRRVVPVLEHDRPPSPDIAAIENLIRSGEFTAVGNIAASRAIEMVDLFS